MVVSVESSAFVVSCEAGGDASVLVRVEVADELLFIDRFVCNQVIWASVSDVAHPS
jgi:hypothetical protein